MDIVTVLPEHVGKIQKLFQNTADEFPNLSEESFLSALRYNIKRNSALAVFENDAAVGIIIYSRVLSRISFLAVDPDYRRHGIGRVLIKKVLDILGGYAELFTYKPESDKYMRPSWVFYEKLGFREEGEAPDFQEKAVRLVINNKDR